MSLSAHEMILVLRARDEASRVLRGFAGSFSQLDKQAAAAANAQFHRGAALATVGVAIAATGITGLVALNNMTDAAMEYNQQAALTQTQLDKVKLSFRDLKDMGLQAAMKLPVAFEQIQPALYDIFSSIDTNAPGAAKLLEGIGKAAVGGSVDMETAGRVNLAILNAWKMKAEDVTHANDVMFQLVRKGVGTYDQFGKSIGRAIPSAIKASQSIESLAGMMAFLTRNGLSTAMSATSAARALDAIANPKTIDKFKKLGVAILDTKGKFRPIVDIISELREKLKNLTPAARAAKLQELFKGAGGAIQAMRFFNLALNDSNGLLKTLTADMNNAGGAAEDAYKIMANTPEAKLQMLSNQYEVLKVKIGEGLLPVKVKLAEMLSKVLEWFNKLSPSTQEWIGKIAALVSALLVVTGIVSAVVGTILMLQAAATVAGVSLAAMAAPIAIAIGAILGLVAAGILIYQNWDTIKAKAIELWEAAQPVFQRIGEVISRVVEHVVNFVKEVGKVVNLGSIWDKLREGIERMVNAIKPHWDKLIKVLVSFGTRAKEITEGVIGWFKRLFDLLKPALYILAGAFTAVANVVGGVLRAAFEVIGNIIGTLIDIFAELIDFVSNIFTNDWEAAWENVKNIFGDIFIGIGQIIQGAWDIIWGAVEGLINGIIGFFQRLYDVLIGHSIVPDLIFGIIEWFGKLPGKVLEFLGTLVTNGIKFFAELYTKITRKVGELVSTVVQWFKDLPGKVATAISTLASDLWTKAGEWMTNINTKVSEGITTTVEWFAGLPGRVLGAVTQLGPKLGMAASLWFSYLVGQIRNGIQNAVEWFAGLPARILSAIAGLADRLWNAGWNIIDSFARGIARRGEAVVDTVRNILQTVRNMLPFSPAKIGPFSGKGWSYYSGLSVFRDFAKGVKANSRLARDAMNLEMRGIQQQLDISNPNPTINLFGSAPVVPLNDGPGGQNPPPGFQLYQTINTQEINPVKHAADLGYELAGRLGF